VGQCPAPAIRGKTSRATSTKVSRKIAPVKGRQEPAVTSAPPVTFTIHDFIGKWRGMMLNVRSASQSHFNDLCHMLGVPTLTNADLTRPGGIKHLLTFKGRPNFCQ
jgi:hypothetical protein